MEALTIAVEFLFSDVSRSGTPTADIDECHGDGKKNCRKIWTNQDVLDTLQPGDYVEILPDLPITLSLRSPPTQTADSKSYVFNIVNIITGENDGEAIITFGNTVVVPDTPSTGYVIAFISNCSSMIITHKPGMILI